MLCSHVMHETDLDFLRVRVFVRFLTKFFGFKEDLSLFPASPTSTAELSRVDAEASESIAPSGIGGLSDSLVRAQFSALDLAFARGLALALATGLDRTGVPPGSLTVSASAGDNGFSC